jgi:hypothetical protein
MSTTNACRAGMSNAFTTPVTAARRKTCQTVTCPRSVRRESASAARREDACVAIRIRRLSALSARAPPTEAKRKTGIWPAKPTSPRRTADPVRR